MIPPERILKCIPETGDPGFPGSSAKLTRRSILDQTSGSHSRRARRRYGPLHAQIQDIANLADRRTVAVIMTDCFPDIWNVLHDGSIEELRGRVPGDLSICVSIEYLRERFDDEGELIIVTLANCSELTFQQYESSIIECDIEAITEQCGGIVSAENENSSCLVWTDCGKLRVACDNVSIALDSGRTISLDELKSVASEYWSEWNSK